MRSYSPTSRWKSEETFDEQIPFYGFAVFVGAMILTGFLTSLHDDNMPRVVGEEEAGYGRFSEERAWRHLVALVGTGPRVAGGRYHREQTEALKALVDGLVVGAEQTVHTDWQIVTDDYYLEYRLPYVNSYERASNVIALLEGESGLNPDGTTNSSVLLNCHYDSVPTSPGASDNAIFCAVMLETLTLLSRSQHKPKHNIVFLFNGAEENSLQASHGFLSHPWSKGVTGLVNLDSAGMNGRAILFQVTDPRVLAAYSAGAPQPSAHALGEVLFTSGIVPSDTDFRIFRDFAGISGVDIAFTRYGHVYHTRYDSLELVRPGVVQHSGDVIHGVARVMADSEEFAVKQERMTTAVYWDYLYLFMVDYSFSTAAVVDSLVGVYGLASVVYYLWDVGMRRRLMRELLNAVLAMIASLLSGCLLVAVLTLVMVATSAQLRYYSHQWVVVPMYWLPFLLGAVSASHAFDWWRAGKSGLNRCRRTSQSMAASRLIWSAVLLCLVPVTASATARYAITVPLFLMATAAFVSITVQRFRRLRAWQHLLMELAMALPGILFIFAITFKMDGLMLPIMGRSLTARPDYVVAFMNVVLAILAWMPLAGVELLFSRKRLWLVISAIGSVCLVLMFIPWTIYSVDGQYPAPQRFNIFHTERITYDHSGVITSRTSGLWAGHTDINSPATLLSHANLTGREVQTDFAAQCEEYLYCNLPTVTPRSADFVPFSVWIDFPPPNAFQPTPGLNLASRSCSDGQCILNFTMTGTPHVSLALWPRDGVTLAGWFFNSPAINVTSRRGRPLYYVYHTHCTHEEERAPFVFSLQLEVASHLNGQTDPILDVAFNAHKNHNEDEVTEEFGDFLRSLPAWFNAVPYITTLINYVF